MRRSALAVALAFLAGAGLLVIHGVRQQRYERQDLYVDAHEPIVQLGPGGRACEAPVGLDEPFDWVAFTPDLGDGASHPRAPIRVVVEEFDSRRRIAQATLPADSREPGPRTVQFADPVRVDEPLSVCFENRGAEFVSLWGILAPVEVQDNAYIAGGIRSQSIARIHGSRVQGDYAIWFGRRGEDLYATRDLISVVPDAFERAARFKAGFVGAWTFWLLLGLLAIGAPVLLARALMAAEREDVR